MSDDPIGDYIDKMGIKAIDPKEIVEDMLVHTRNLSVRLEVAARLLEKVQEQKDFNEIGPVS